MNVSIPGLLAQFRTPGFCECCDCLCAMRAAHHIFSRGAGQVDWPPNLIALGWDAPGCTCHVGHHYSGKPTTEAFLAITAKREGMLAEDIKPVIDAVRACPRQNTLTAAKRWLRTHFPRDVAEPAIDVIRINYAEDDE